MGDRERTNGPMVIRLNYYNRGQRSLHINNALEYISTINETIQFTVYEHEHVKCGHEPHPVIQRNLVYLRFKVRSINIVDYKRGRGNRNCQRS